ncbi:hypothetical protein J4E85_010857 [Alternaria conjuncta]|uniref:uncharacterized protein n=1 Tax=Alternaria conjuncta TaxID=181017 RepID=UPI00221F0AED|nr:uncharacterized protein J4E85_010857 [Alternaria conjuncta]KAI4913125.1 hypothetical protein J4E85_010857 [Alternaria conjuncta]
MDWSYFPQEDIAARLPTASQTKLCEPCKALLRSDRTAYVDEDEWENQGSRQKYVHHNDARSFRRALELRCDICVRLYKALKRPYGQPYLYEIEPTTYELDTHLEDLTMQDLIYTFHTLPVIQAKTKRSRGS